MESTDKSRLVVFDVEGVLIPRNRFVFEVGKSLGFVGLVKMLFFGFLYEAGILNLESTLKRIYKEMRGINLEALMFTFSKIPATPYLQSFFCQLKARNCKIALISSGIPTVIVQKLAAALGADYAYGVEIEVAEDKLTGAIWGDAITKKGKYKILQEILKQENLPLKDCVVVADDRNNSCIFLPDILKIGFDPDFIIRVKADRVVNGKLTGILPILDGKPHKHSFPSANDLVREGIHAAGIFMPVIAGLIGVPIVAAIIILIALIIHYIRALPS